MRIILFFDIPNVTKDDQREYRRFRKAIIKNGYIMMQESVYSKLTTNYTACNLEIEKIRKIKPKSGIVQCLTITENQFASIINVCGASTHSQIDTTDRLVIL